MKYEIPELKINLFSQADILTTSDGFGDNETSEKDQDWDD